MNQKINTMNNDSILRPFPSDRIGKAAKANPEPCLWVEDTEGYWDGSCGVKWMFEFGTPRENKMQFCLRCGKRLKQKGGSK